MEEWRESVQSPDDGYDDWGLVASDGGDDPGFVVPEYLLHPSEEDLEAIDELEPVTIRFDLLPKQWEAWDALDDDTTFEVVYGGAVGVGKTYFGCAWVILMAVTNPSTTWMICRKTYMNLKQTTMADFWRVAKDLGLERDVHFYSRSSGSMEVYFPNGSRIYFRPLPHYPTDPQYSYLGSYNLSGVYVDECVEVTKDAWTTLFGRIRYNVPNDVPKILGTCNPSPGWVREGFFDPWEKGELEETKRFVRVLPPDSALPKSYYDRLRTTYSPWQVLAYIEGFWHYAEGALALYKTDWKRDLFDAALHKALRTGTTYITVDVARQGKDKTVIFVWDGMLVVDAAIVQNAEGDAVAKRVVELARKHRTAAANIVVDIVGVGSSVGDFIRTTYGPVTKFEGGAKAVVSPRHVVPYFNLKSQCFYALSQAAVGISPEVGAMVVEGADRKTLKELILAELAVVMEQPTEGKLRVNSKDEQKGLLGRSPDFADALSMRMLLALRPQGGMIIAGR